MDKESVLKQIRECLRNAGFDTYYPSQHQGECTKEYVVIAFSGGVETTTVSSTIDTYDIMCYVPNNRYSRIVEMQDEVRKAMRKIFPLVRETGTATSAFFDDDVKGYTVSISYANYRKIKYRE